MLRQDRQPATSSPASDSAAPESSLEVYRRLIFEVISSIVPCGADVVLFDFPNHTNVGDSAIWLGELCFLMEDLHAKLRAVEHINCRALPSLRSETIILLHGGGNLGDLWEHHQLFRERIIHAYPGNRIVQLPQSIHFQRRSAFDRCKAVFSSHRDFHLLVRDAQSLEYARQLHDGPSALCPDMALALRAIRRPARHSSQIPILALLRTDQETNLDDFSALGGDVKVLDWVDASRGRTGMAIDFLDRAEARIAFHGWPVQRLKKQLFNQQAQQNVERGCDMLAAGQVVITDRLHAHILCALMGVPHVVLDNSYGKLFRFIETWRTDTGLCRIASNLVDAVVSARLMVPEGSTRHVS